MTGAQPNPIKRVVVFGASGTAGQGAVRGLLARGYDVFCVVRAQAHLPPEVTQITADVTQPLAAQITGRFDAVVSCLASRSGAPNDAWAIDYRAQLNVLDFAERAGAGHFVLLSAICVQKPKLPFQKAKLAFESALIKSGLSYSIVRPTAFFKSLSGQIDRVKAGKPFLVFGNGLLTACKPISDDDLGLYIADCLTDPARLNQVLPVGGPGEAITPMDQAAELSRLLDRPVKVKRVPVALIRTIYQVLRMLGKVSPKAAQKAQLARIGHYYATESMLVWDETAGRYDAVATPSSGSTTLFDYYAELVAGTTSVERGDHSVF